MAIKKSAPKKIVKKSVSKKPTAKKKAPKKETIRSAKQKIKPPLSQSLNKKSEVTASKSAKAGPPQNCKCMQRKTKFYCYHLVQGRWVQASAIGFTTKAMCEDNCCN